MDILQFIAIIFGLTIAFLTIVGCISIKYDYKKLEEENEKLKNKLKKREDKNKWQQFFN